MTRQKNTRVKKDRRSLYLIGGILVLALAAWGIMTFVSSQSNEASRQVHVVDGNGNEYFYPLSEGGEHTFTTDYGTNVIEITDDGVKMASSTCPNQDCVHVGVIHSSSEMILCLPNQVLVTIIDENSDESAPDTTVI